MQRSRKIHAHNSAVWRRKPAEEVLVYSEQGSQFSSDDYLRIYPWNTAANAGKQLALYNVKVSGKVAQ